MTDLDQKREADSATGTPGLPDHGKMHCVPTVAMDLIAYVANHGYPNLMPRAGSYGPAVGPGGGNYKLMTALISWMGDLMVTDPITGASYTDSLNGIKKWLEISGQENLTASVSSSNKNTIVRLDQMAAAAIEGAVVAPVIGYYKEADEKTGWTRTSGHVLALSMAHRQNGVIYQVGLRDPANNPADDDLYSQSAFTSDVYDVEPVLPSFFQRGPDAQPPKPQAKRPLTLDRSRLSALPAYR